MKKLSMMVGAILMLGSINVFADCPTAAQCNAITDTYAKAQCFQQAQSSACGGSSPYVPRCTTTKGICHVGPNPYCNTIPVASRPALCETTTTTICEPDKTVCI